MVDLRALRIAEELKDELAIAITGAIEEDIITGFMICEDSKGDLTWDKSEPIKGKLKGKFSSGKPHLYCRTPYQKPKASILVKLEQ